jgi:hypothetical protein
LTESEDEKSFKSWHSDPKIQLPALNQTNKSKFWKIANKNEGTLPKVNRRKPLNV